MITTKWNIYKALTNAWEDLTKLHKVKSGFDSQEDAFKWLEENINNENLTQFFEYIILPVYKFKE